MADQRGIYNKYDVVRNDGQDLLGEKHFGCSYFVLDLTHDEVARVLMPVLADNYEAAGREQLAADIRTMLAQMSPVDGA